MKSYEMIREIFNECARNQMRDVFFSEIETDDPDAVVREYLKGSSDVACEKEILPGGVIRYNFSTDGLLQRITLTEI